MLFNRILISMAVALPLIACSDQPGKESNSPPAADTTAPSLPPATGSGAASGGTTGGTPTAPDPLTPPINTGPSSFTLSGPVVGSQKNDTYLFKICAGTICDSWQSTVENGVFEYTFELSQWPQDKNVLIEGNKVETSARSNASAEINSKANSYFKTELDSLANLQKWDGDKDGVLNEQEVATLSLDSVTMAYQTVASYLLANQLKQHADKPYHEKHQAVRHYLSENSLNTLFIPNEEQLSLFKKHTSTLGTFGARKIYGEYSMQLTHEQWENLGGSVDTPIAQRIIRLNTAQMYTLYTRDRERVTTNKQFELSVQQAAIIQGKLVYNQQLVLELAALYQLLTPQQPIVIELGTSSSGHLDSQIKALNPGEGEATRFEGTYTAELSREHQHQLGLYDEPTGKNSATLQINADTMRDAYQTAQLNKQQGGSDNYTFVLTPMLWPTANKAIQFIGLDVLQVLETNPTRALWRHYRDRVVNQANPVVVYSGLQHDLSADIQQEYRFLHKVNELVTANHKHPLKTAILGLAPEKYLRLSGRFPKELQAASLKIIIGSRLKSNLERDNGRYPIRHIPVPLINDDGSRQVSLNLSNQSGFVTKVALRDIDNHFTRCEPGSPTEGEYKFEYTDDEMQDTLTIHISDQKTGTELRSILGSFCELAKLDQSIGNGNDILEFGEFERLNVGYISTAQSALLMRLSLSQGGTALYTYPFNLEQISSMYKNMPRKQVELLAAVVAAQVKGELSGRLVNLVEGANLYEDLLSLIGVALSDQHGAQAASNQIPNLEFIQTNLSEKYAVGQLLLNRLDINISHITQEMTSLLSASIVDNYYFPKDVRPGSWVSVYPVSILEPTCQTELNESQILGVGIAGKGKDSQGDWITIRWDTQAGASSYSIGWQKSPFDNITSAAHQLTTRKGYATLHNLEANSTYFIRVQSDIGLASETFELKPNQLFIADTRVVRGSSGDDSTRGRDSDPTCDKLTGKAQNSNHDGIFGARYIKLDEKGIPLKRQDLIYKQQPFHCVLDAHTGLVWETKRARKKDAPYSIHDDDNMFAMTAPESANAFAGSCFVPQLNIHSNDPAMCSVNNQTHWVNSNKLCGLNNWRVPTVQELYGLMSFGRKHRDFHAITMDTRYFPLTRIPSTNGSQHGLWSNSLSQDKKQGRVLIPNRNLGLEQRNIHSAQLLMLVSDGFKTEQR
ncbi:DUF1566 domain-containing protein [Vibrio mimicus]|uniref:Lcl domain-containing protein n=1 Tax=Vibrio mimicus TaxID=674 RepID=UPI002F91C17A